MAPTCTDSVSSWVPPCLPESSGSGSGSVLLDRWCYIADLPNDTTAESTTSSGLPIKVTFRAARPPLLSHFCVHCPGLDFRRIGPKIVATDADLVLLCVPLDPNNTVRALNWDYFVYSPREWLHLLPNPHGSARCLHDEATALISRQDGASYAVAALGVRTPVYDGRTLISWEFDLHLYRSDSSNAGWISKRLSVDEFERDKLIPLPGSSVDRFYHETGKTITIGGEHGTVAWVDLWRGIFFCDVLEERPLLRDVPLPVPARANWERLLRNGDPNYLRDVTISRNKDSIKYVELEFRTREELINDAADDTTPVSYAEWVRNRSSRKYQVSPDGWKSTTWNMAIPTPVVGGSWHHDCVLDVEDISLEASLEAMLSSKTTQTFKELPVGYPVLSMDDDDVVYLLMHMDELAMVLAIDMRKATLRGLAELDVHKFILFPNFCASEICRGST